MLSGPRLPGAALRTAAWSAAQHTSWAEEGPQLLQFTWVLWDIQFPAPDLSQHHCPPSRPLQGASTTGAPLLQAHIACSPSPQGLPHAPWREGAEGPHRQPLCPGGVGL